MSLHNLLSSVFNAIDNKKSLTEIKEIIIREKGKNIQIGFRDAVQIFKRFLPQKNIINFDDLRTIEQLKKVKWLQLKISTERDKKYVLYCLMFLLIFVVKPESSQTVDYANVVRLIEQIRDIKVKNYDFGTGNLSNVIEDVCVEVENKKFHDHFEYNFPFCDSVIKIFKTNFPSDVLCGKIFNQVLYFVPQKVNNNPDFKDQKGNLYKLVLAYTINQTSLVPVHFPRLARNNRMYFDDKKYVLNYGILLHPIFVQKMNKGYLDWKLRDFSQNRNAMELSNIKKLHCNDFKQIAFDYSNIYDTFNMNLDESDTEYPQKYEYLSNVYKEFVRENITVLFVHDIAKEIGFIHSYMQENGFDTFEPKKPNYYHVLSELVNFSYGQVQKERFTRSYKYGLRESYGPHILKFLKHHNLNPSDRLSIQSFFMVNSRRSQKSFFPGQLRTSSAPRPAVNSNVASMFQTSFGRNTYRRNDKRNPTFQTAFGRYAYLKANK